MAQANINLSIDNNNFSKSKTYNNIYENTQEIDNTDGLIDIYQYLLLKQQYCRQH